MSVHFFKRSLGLIAISVVIKTLGSTILISPTSEIGYDVPNCYLLIDLFIKVALVQ